MRDARTPEMLMREKGIDYKALKWQSFPYLAEAYNPGK